METQVIKATIRDKYKKQHTRPTEDKAAQTVLSEAEDAGVAIGKYIRLCRWAAKDVREVSVFYVAQHALSQIEVKRKVTRPISISQALFSTQFGIMGDEP
jgi:hypothetical protein